MVRDYRHRTGEHCASTALRNLLEHRGTELSEGMIFGLASGLGFFYLSGEGMSPSRMFHGRTMSLESDFGLNTGVPLVDRIEPSDEVAWQTLRAAIDRGEPVMVSTDTFYLGYHNTSSHFPGHRCVVVGYDDPSETVLIADRKFDEYQRCSYEELRKARNAPDYPMSSQNQYGAWEGPPELGASMEEAIPRALERNARGMLEPDDSLAVGDFASTGASGMRKLAEELPSWAQAEDWSWAARFGYQVVIKRGAGGSFFRSLYADFLHESASHVPGLEDALPASRMHEIAARWRDVAALLKEQSERETCEPRLFVDAGKRVAELADAEERFFDDALRFAERLP